MKNQIILQSQRNYSCIYEILRDNCVNKYLLVSGKSINQLALKDYIDNIKIPMVIFDEFNPNPVYESVVKGVDIIKKEQCKFIIAVGGGSAIDVAKCIKLYANMNTDISFFEQPIIPNDINLLAIPTTAGTGSESTKFAVIYYNGEKQSVSHESIIPDYVLLDSSLLNTLPSYQKKVTVLDALCHAIESYWSINSNEESMSYSSQAINLIYKNIDDYLYNDNDEAAEKIMFAANISGKAINITQTTAPHAMSYKLSSLCNIPHGQAVALCLPKVWRHMLSHLHQCCDNRGYTHLEEVFRKMAFSMECEDVNKAIDKFNNIVRKMNLPKLSSTTIYYLNELVQSVNLERLKNNPVHLNEEDLQAIYFQICKE